MPTNCNWQLDFALFPTIFNGQTILKNIPIFPKTYVVNYNKDFFWVHHAILFCKNSSSESKSVEALLQEIWWKDSTKLINIFCCNIKSCSPAPTHTHTHTHRVVNEWPGASDTPMQSQKDEKRKHTHQRGLYCRRIRTSQSRCKGPEIAELSSTAPRQDKSQKSGTGGACEDLIIITPEGWESEFGNGVNPFDLVKKVTH